ncbi:MAG TPA: nuclear transport factor 2 family protein [Streptosporangiaceae bacterium]
MDASDPTREREVVEAYWDAAARRDWSAFTALVAEDVVYEAPQTRERVSGRAAYYRFNAEGFPGDWHFSVERVVGHGGHAASWIHMHDAGEEYPGVCFFDFSEDGLIARITDFWPTPAELPASRAHLSERY